MDRARKTDEKNGVICLVIMVISRVMIIKMSRMAIFLFSADDRKELVTVWEKALNTTERFFLFLLENSMVNSLCSYHSRDIEDRNIKKC